MAVKYFHICSSFSDQSLCILQVWYLSRTRFINGKGNQRVFPESRFSHAGFTTRWVNLNPRNISSDYHQPFRGFFTVLPVMCVCAVVSCGWLSPPQNGTKDGITYLQGARVWFSCEDGFKLRGSEVRVCLKNGTWSGEETKCLVPSMIKS